MPLFDLHTHSTFSDGKNSPEEMVLFAIKMGLSKIGISDHAYTLFDESYCINKNRIDEYICTVNALKEKYKNQIDVLLGIEQDYYSQEPVTPYDYVIGSVHYIKIKGQYIPVDENAKILKDAANEYFDGDIYSLIELYYDTVADVVNKTNADIIGHFDLISKFNENGELFDESNTRYIATFKKAADTLIKSKAVFEINTGAISRGYRTSPYPSNTIHKYLKEQNAKFILSSDSHDKHNLCYCFDKFEKMI